MLPRLGQLLRDRAAWPRLALFAAAGAAAVVLGFRLFSPAQIEQLIVHGGYPFMLALFAGLLFFAARVAAPHRAAWAAWRPGWGTAAVAAATLFAVWSDAFAHKVLFDEYVLQGTAWHMHATKEIGAPIRAYDFAGTWLAIDTFLDKRPYFFAFVVSLLHDLTGFRVENVYVANVACTGLTLALVYWLVHRLTSRAGPASLAVALLATLPLFGQNATGAGMEMHNLAMIAVAMLGATLYLEKPDGDRLSLLVIAAALLAQCRYESALFVAPVGAIVALGWWRAGRIVLPWVAVIAPLLLVPYAWLDRFVQSKPILWQLREGDTSRFGLRYLEGNLEGARRFFFNASANQPNSLWLTLAGLAALVVVAITAVRWLRRPRAERPAWAPAQIAVAWFGGFIAANLGLLMFYYWSRLDEPIASRFALPLCFALAVVAGWAAHALDRRWPATRVAAAGLAVWLLGFAATAYAHRFYTEHNQVMHELHWEFEQVAARPGPVLVITSKATMPYLLHRIPAVNTALARGRGAEITWHRAIGTFREVLVTRVLRPTTAEGDLVVDPEDVLPENFRLESLTRKRFGGRWIEVCRLTEISAEPPPAQ
ncbi:MAG: glycosyltransferase family 39 protein [Opitutaceae bacterium]|nr:glycosyltransferase family 39 protein [Opitutaceae bacterium]